MSTEDLLATAPGLVVREKWLGEVEIAENIHMLENSLRVDNSPPHTTLVPFLYCDKI